MTRPHLELVAGGADAPRWIPALELGAIAIGLALCFTWAGALPSWSGELGRFQLLMAVAFSFLALVLLRADRYRGLPHLGAFVVVVGFVLRAAVIPTTPTLSDDIYRYVWEGRVIAAGHDPYAHAPDSPELAALRDARIHPHVNHPQLSTIYPPLAELGFALVARLSATVMAMKVWILLHDLVLVAVLAAWCQQRSGSAIAAVAYAWNPLVIAEYAGSGHHDPTALLGLALALKWMDRRPVASALALACAALIKLAPLVALPFLWRRWPKRARLAAVLVLAPGLALFVAWTRGRDSGLSAYVAHWRNNESLFQLLAFMLGDARARIAAGVLLAALLVWLWRRRSEPLDATRSLLRGSLLLGPVVHPWYLGWELMFQPLRNSAPWLLLSALALGSYGVLTPPADRAHYHLSIVGRAFEYGLPFALAILIHWQRRRARETPHGL